MLKQVLESPHINPKNAFKLLLAMHIAGAIGLAIPETRAYFQILTPFNLLATAAIVFHFEAEKSVAYIGLLIISFLGGFGIEVAGVHTGVIFGEYAYGPTLGFKLWEVPLAIGLNWAVLIYCTGLFSDQFKVAKPIRALIGAALMVGLDFLIEPVAIQLDFWNWATESIPLQNYIAWFFVSLVLQAIYQALPFSKNNPLAIKLLYIEVMFFLALNFI